MKKILCFIDSLTSGGAQRQLVGLAISLKQQGYEVTVLTYHHIPFYLRELDIANVRYVYLSKAEKKAKRIWALYSFFKELHPDIVIAYLNMPSMIACIIKFLGLNFKLIVSERNTTQKLSFSEKIKFKLYSYSDFVVPNSYSQKRFLEDNYPNLSSKIYVITNFTDINLFNVTEVRNVFSTKKNVLVVGRVTEQKNVIGFLEVISEIKKKGIVFHIKWFGYTPSKKYFEQVTVKLHELGLQDDVEFLNPVSSIVSEYQQSDVFCLPSYYEGFPNVICEAMACGKPILCSNVCDNPDIVEDGVNGFLFDPYDTQSILEALCRFFALDETQYNSFCLKSRQIAIKNFSKSNFIMKYKKIIEE